MPARPTPYRVQGPWGVPGRHFAEVTPTALTLWGTFSPQDPSGQCRVFGRCQVAQTLPQRASPNHPSARLLKTHFRPPFWKARKGLLFPFPLTKYSLKHRGYMKTNKQKKILKGVEKKANWLRTLGALPDTACGLRSQCGCHSS